MILEPISILLAATNLKVAAVRRYPDNQRTREEEEAFYQKLAPKNFRTDPRRRLFSVHILLQFTVISRDEKKFPNHQKYSAQIAHRSSCPIIIFFWKIWMTLNSEAMPFWILRPLIGKAKMCFNFQVRPTTNDFGNQRSEICKLSSNAFWPYQLVFRMQSFWVIPNF